MSPSPSDPAAQKRRVLIVTGMSGAGMSTALKTLEDLGYEAVDNLRLSMIGALVQPTGQSAIPIAVGVDTRNAEFTLPAFQLELRKLQSNPALDVKLVYFECSDEALQRRFSETRRRHPLAADRPVTDGIKREREIIGPMGDLADEVIDTSLLTVHELRRIIAGHFRLGQTAQMTLFITSFAFRQGIPREADLLFDVRFLKNPHWDTALRPLTGKDAPVAQAIQKDPAYKPFIEGLTKWLTPLLPRYAAEGKNYLTIAIGCTGGKHRSVFIAEQLATIMAAQGYIVGIGHRDLERQVKE